MEYLKINNTFCSEFFIRGAVSNYFQCNHRIFGGADRFFVYELIFPAFYRNLRPDLWVNGEYIGPLKKAYENIYPHFERRYIANGFGIPYLKNYLTEVYNLKPKRTTIEAYMTAGFANVKTFGHPVSAALDYDAAFDETRVQSGQRDLYLLETNNVIALPLDATVRILVTSEDVIHS